MRARAVVVAAALLAAALRFPGLLWPIRPDEAGFVLVGRSWHPQPDSVYGFFWVDRPPTLIALVRLSDLVGGPLFLRVVAAAGCVVLVLAAAATARAMVRLTATAPDAGGTARADGAAAWTALAAAALVGNEWIDPAAAKGEVLGLPLLMVGIWLSLRALERRTAWAAGLAGLLGMLAVGLKQNALDVLVFGAVVLVGSVLSGRLPGRDGLRLGGAAALGAAVPVVATVGWAVVAGVHLSELAYVVVGFRSDAARVIAADPSSHNAARRQDLLVFVRHSGMRLLAVWFVLRLPALLRTAPVLTAAALLVAAGDVVGLVLGGSYWRPYAFGLIPSLLVGTALLLAVPARRLRPLTRLVAPALVVLTVVATAHSVVELLDHEPEMAFPPKEYRTGRAIAAVAGPDDSLVVYGGRADVQFGSGLPTPYRFLWSLPMRVLDPRLTELRGVLDGPRAPTWFVAWAPLTSWGDLGQRGVGAALAEHYTLHDTVCGRQVYLLDGRTRPHLRVDCTSPAF